MDDLIADFLAETRVALDRVGDALTRIDRGGALSDNLHEVTTGIGAIRSRAGALGFVRLALLSEAFEEALARHLHRAAIAPDFLRTMERAFDRSSRLIAMIAATGAEPLGGDPDLIAALGEDGDALARAHKVAEAIAPAEPADPWAQFDRLVEAAARELNKNITLTIEASARALPEPLVRSLSGPIAMVLRHACVYSLEVEVLRRARGKRAVGAIRIAGISVDADAVIAISDDGGGLDLARLRARAVTLKRVKHAEAANMSDADAAALLFVPGVSSYGEGEGATGLDAAKDAIERLGGAIEVNSLPGRGATFLIRAPMPALGAIVDFSGAEDEKLSGRR